MPNLYNCTFDEITNTYVFITKNKILYRIAFIIDETFSTIAGEEIENVFQIVIEKASEEKEPYDLTVSKTIEHLIEQFFKKVENALIYVCSDDDEKALKRFKTFERWYKNSQHKNSITKLDNVIVVTNEKRKVQKIYTSFIFHKQNINYQKLINIYYKIEEVLNEEK